MQKIDASSINKRPIRRLPWLWPTIIILSAVAAGLVTFTMPDTLLRQVIVIWFLLVCPGMVLVRSLRLQQSVVEWTLALALSFAIDAIVAGTLLYAGRWSPTATLVILIGLCLGGAIVQLISMYSTTTFLPKQLHTVLSGPRAILIALSLALLIGISLGSLGAGLWYYLVYQNPRSASSTVVLPSRDTPHPSPRSTAAPTPSSSASVHLASSYSGTLYNIPMSTTTNMSLTRIQQSQTNISGYFTGFQVNGLQVNEPFSGTIDAHGHIQFKVAEYAGQIILSFTGSAQADGTLQGNYCSLDQQGQCAGEYGPWSVSPGAGRTFSPCIYRRATSCDADYQTW